MNYGAPDPGMSWHLFLLMVQWTETKAAQAALAALASVSGGVAAAFGKGDPATMAQLTAIAAGEGA